MINTVRMLITVASKPIILFNIANAKDANTTEIIFFIVFAFAAKSRTVAGWRYWGESVLLY